MNLSEEHPEVNIKEWSCFPKETYFNGMHAWRRFENKRGSAHISDKKLSNASLMCPLEHKVANCSLPSEKRPFWKWVLKEIVEKRKIEFWKTIGTEKRVRETTNLPMDETWANGCLWGWVEFLLKNSKKSNFYFWLSSTI